MVNGLPGNVATLLANHIQKHDQFDLIPYSFTGPEIRQTEVYVGSLQVALIAPENQETKLLEIKAENDAFIIIDFTHPSAVMTNASIYLKHLIPFVMGTTGGDYNQLCNMVKQSKTSAIIAPNMAKQIVGFQAIMEYAAQTFPDLFKGYHLEIKESHQDGKADTSGTARAMVGNFNKLGVLFTEDKIKMVRDPKVQEEELNVPKAYLSGHAWHTYTLTSADDTVKFSFTHNINGRDIYMQGIFDAVFYLQNKLDDNATSSVFSMIDVLKGV